MQMRWLLWFQIVFGISPRKMKHHNIELDNNRRRRAWLGCLGWRGGPSWSRAAGTACPPRAGRGRSGTGRLSCTRGPRPLQPRSTAVPRPLLSPRSTAVRYSPWCTRSLPLRWPGLTIVSNGARRRSLTVRTSFRHFYFCTPLLLSEENVHILGNL